MRAPRRSHGDCTSFATRGHAAHCTVTSGSPMSHASTSTLARPDGADTSDYTVDPPQHPQRRLRHRRGRRDAARRRPRPHGRVRALLARATSARSSATTASRTRSSSRRCASGRRRRPRCSTSSTREHHLLDRLMEERRGGDRGASSPVTTPTGAADAAAPPGRRDGRPPRPRGPRDRPAVRSAVPRRRVRGADEGGDQAGRARQAGRLHGALHRLLGDRARAPTLLGAAPLPFRILYRLTRNRHATLDAHRARPASVDASRSAACLEPPRRLSVPAR